MPKICIIQTLYPKESMPTTPPYLIHNPHNTPQISNSSFNHNKVCIACNRPGFAARSRYSCCLTTKIMHFLWNNPVMRRDLARFGLRRKKNPSAPRGQIVPLNAVFPLFINIFVGWDALAKARRGKEKN